MARVRKMSILYSFKTSIISAKKIIFLFKKLFSSYLVTQAFVYKGLQWVREQNTTYPSYPKKKLYWVRLGKIG